MSRSEIPLLVAIDAGGSKTHIQVESAYDNMLLLDQVYESTGWASLDGTQRAKALLALVEATTAQLGMVKVVVAGVHGNDSPEQEAVLSGPLAARYPRVRVLNDSHLLILAHGKASGTGLIAGTGSSVTATVGDNALTVGGWGWIFGDEGGATGIVRDAARAALAAYDGGESDPFAEQLLAWFGVDHPHGLEYVFSTQEPRVWAKAAPLVFDAAKNGSVRALDIINAHALALARQVALLKQRQGDVSTVVCAGGVIVSQPLLFNAFSREVRRLVGQSTQTALLLEPPVKGAISLARHLYLTSQQEMACSSLPATHRLFM
ncbi:N-acetylglucosamine kinase [Biostraticola tofi]|uniref:N-acetylglucosamine kinase-like BadF-type ATPase n=1 Tax=Biostraticola tofi TaxID=466109 RepID=A0A4R3YUT3_9GAMM|nr:BadF/BadG/BcrA/BcrD ATPase family protein [Biostraticola tofi]TCV95114.1 N-acetylglucosamine kinase-like BadF-type ATPase [Biostraticola tofi]